MRPSAKTIDAELPRAARRLSPTACVLVTLLICLCPAIRAELEVFASFEDSTEVEAIKASAGVQVKASTRFPAWEGNSLEVTVPAEGGAIRTSRIPGDWRRQQSLLAFVWSLQPSEVTILLSDSAGEEYSKPFRIRPGVNHLQVRLDQAGNLNLRSLRSLTVRITAKGVYYFDYFALDRFHPVLEQRGRWDIDYSMGVETPHVPWGRPLAGGPIKTFAIGGVADGRGIVELAERLDLNFRATTIGASPGVNKWGFGDFYEQRSGGSEFWKHAYSLAHAYIADDMIYGPQYDVILWPAIRPWNSYPVEIREAIRRRVEEGAGLVLFGLDPGPGSTDIWSPYLLSRTAPPGGRRGEDTNLDRSHWKADSPHYITTGIAWDAFPWGFLGVPPSRPSARTQILARTQDGSPLLAVGTFGKGRVVAFGYAEKGMIPAVSEVFETGLYYPYHEYLWAMVTRAVVWAAHREPDGGIEKMTVEPNGVSVRSRNAPAGSRLRVTVRSAFGEVEGDEQLLEITDAQPAVISLPSSKAGRFLVEAQLLSGGRVLDWAATTIELPEPVSLVSLAPAVDRVKVGEDVPVKLKLAAPKASDCHVSLRLLDNYDRLLDEQSFDLAVAGEAERTLTLNTAGALTHLARIDCEVLAGGVRSDRKIAEVFVLQPRKWDDYDIVMYGFGPDPMPGTWPVIDRQIRRLNVTTLSSYTLNQSKHANFNVQAQTRISGQESPDGPARDYYSRMKKKYLETGDKTALAREYCLDDPAYRKLVTRELRELTAPWVPFSPMSYYVYEEPSMTCYGDAVDICFSPHTLAAMRLWLREEYGTLEALNRQWGTQFPDWDSVVPDDYREAQARGNYSSWADHRTYMEKTYADSFAFVLSELRKIDPEGILLNSGTQISGSHNGCDYSRINQYTRHLNAYSGGNQLDFHRCFNPDLKISGGAGYGVLGKDVFYNFYNNLFKGANGGAYVFWQYSTLDPDLTMSQSGKDMAEGFDELRGEGIGRLVGRATPENNGIAIHYSYPSIHASWIVDGAVKEKVSYDTSQSFSRFSDNRDGWVKIFKDSGLQFDFIAYSDLEKGALRSKGYKVLVLPMSYAMSDAEVSAVREFVAEGGTLIADALPAIMDNHCRFRETRSLGDVFGIELSPGSREAILEANGEPTFKLAGAQSLGQVDTRPALLAHRFGKGRAYLLNYFLDGYPQDKLEKRTGPSRERFATLLQDAGIAPEVRLVDVQGKAVADCSTYLFHNGSTRLLGIVPDKQKPEPQEVIVKLDRESAIYDVRRKRYLGSARQFTLTAEPAVPCLYALIEKPLGDLTVSIPANAALGAEIEVGYTLAGGSDLRSVAIVIVKDPSGKEIGWYRGNTDTVNGRGQYRFRTALDDPPGRWEVSVTDAISGATAVGDVEVVSPH